jgi:hypothetical protein
VASFAGNVEGIRGSPNRTWCYRVHTNVYRRALETTNGSRLWPHFVLTARLQFLMLLWTNFPSSFATEIIRFWAVIQSFLIGETQRKNAVDDALALVSLLTRLTRAPKTFGVVLVHLGLQIELNFVPA